MSVRVRPGFDMSGMAENDATGVGALRGGHKWRETVELVSSKVAGSGGVWYLTLASKSQGIIELPEGVAVAEIM